MNTTRQEPYGVYFQLNYYWRDAQNIGWEGIGKLKENSVPYEHHGKEIFPKYLNNKIVDENLDVGEEDAKSDLEINNLNTDKAINEGTNLGD